MKPIKISMRTLGGIGNLRISAHFFNTEEEIDYLIDLQKADDVTVVENAGFLFWVLPRPLSQQETPQLG